jgi:hypothetical protein
MLKLRWLEDPLTIATPPFDHTGVVALKGQAKNLEAVYRVRTASPPMALSQQQNRRLFYSAADTHYLL